MPIGDSGGKKQCKLCGGSKTDTRRGEILKTMKTGNKARNDTTRWVSKQSSFAEKIFIIKDGGLDVESDKSDMTETENLSEKRPETTEGKIKSRSRPARPWSNNREDECGESSTNSTGAGACETITANRNATLEN